MLKIPAFFFPTTVLILDDDKNFSHMLKMALEDTFHIQPFSNQVQLKEYLEKSTQTLPTLSNAQKVKEYIDSGYSKNMISVLVTDYLLEDTTGLEFLAQIKPNSIQKILMSNFVHSNIVHEAYDTRLIHGYLPKFDNDFILKLRNKIAELQYRFFIDLNSLAVQTPAFRPVGALDVVEI